MASHEGSRKRFKISRTEERALSKDKSPVALRPTSSHQSQSCGPPATSASCQHEQALKTLNTDVDSMRQLVTCKICHRLLYEPYSLSCGHTYCYSCLSQWLVDSRKKTCPDCRAVVTQQPTPSYVIRELVLIFVGRNELLPDGETSDEHHGYVREEAEIVAKDKANTDPRIGGLFKGCFKRGRHSVMGPIHDPGDGVDRCPLCHWELEDGYCNQCGEVVDLNEHLGFSEYDSDSDITDDELDHELDIEDAREVFGADGQDEYLGGYLTDDGFGFDDRGPPQNADARPRHVSLIQRRAHQNRGAGSARAPINLGSSDEEESDDEEAHGELRDFIVNDDDVESAGSNEDEDTDVTARNQIRSCGNRRAPAVLSDDNDDGTAASAGAVAESDPDSDDEGPVVRGSQRNKRGRVPLRQRQARTISSDEEESENGRIDDNVSDIINNGGFSPLDGSAARDTASLPSGDDSEPTSSVHPMYDESENDSYAYGHGTYNDSNDDELDEESDGYDEDGWGSRSP